MLSSNSNSALNPNSSNNVLSSNSNNALNPSSSNNALSSNNSSALNPSSSNSALNPNSSNSVLSSNSNSALNPSSSNSALNPSSSNNAFSSSKHHVSKQHHALHRPSNKRTRSTRPQTRLQQTRARHHGEPFFLQQTASLNPSPTAPAAPHST